ncbi:MAG: cytochrome c nitrite reductase small subunit [Deltaproteobacteria bacterium]|nr:cytochrome c nitrite reductase small subunit [Deltaproteobacteria bacterium]
MLRKVITAAVVLCLLLAIAYGRRIYHYSETPAFCNSCHIMNYQYENFIHSGAHQSKKCIDCHLPNDNFANHLLWKGIDGTKDVIYFYGGLYTEPVIISNHGRKVVQENCISCHSEMVSRINTTERRCTDCHRRHTHKHTGVF